MARTSRRCSGIMQRSCTTPDARSGQPLGVAVVTDARELEPDRGRPLRHGKDLLGVPGQVLGAAKHLDHVGRLGQVGESGDRWDAEHALAGDGADLSRRIR